MPATAPAPPYIAEVDVAQGTHAALRATLNDLIAGYGDVESPAFLRRASTLGHCLPQAVLDALGSLRYLEAEPALIVRNCPLSDDPGPTPAHWSAPSSRTARAYEFWLALLLAQLGDFIGFAESQGGALRRNVLPLRKADHDQTGYGSRAELELHVDDAVDDDRGDAFGLLCMRPGRHAAPTMIAPIAALDLSALDLDALFTPRYTFIADGVRCERPVLFGDREAPYIRLDPPFTEIPAAAGAARKAVSELSAALRSVTVDVPLARGEALLIDNYRCAHGRRAFDPHYDGEDRWLIKMTVARDLRRTRLRRDGPDQRVIAPLKDLPMRGRHVPVRG
jgi:L-asparagine oxygenase